MGMVLKEDRIDSKMTDDKIQERKKRTDEWARKEEIRLWRRRRGAQMRDIQYVLKHTKDLGLCEAHCDSTSRTCRMFLASNHKTQSGQVSHHATA